MKSPITGKEMSRTYEWRTIPFRKENFEIPYQYYLCEESGEHFTSTALDELNMQMVHNSYRAKHHIPLANEIKEIRERYDLSAARMSEILGFGPNSYRLYEAGDVPSLPNANLIKMAGTPKVFKSLVEEWIAPDDKVKETLLKKIERIIEERSKNIFSINLSHYLMGDHFPDEFTGFIKPNLNKLGEMVVFFAHQFPCYKTKMNKLLFYADFSNFRSHGQSISGARYKAIPYGPVPESFESIFEKLAKDDVIDNFYEEMDNGSFREEFVGRSDRPFNKSIFSESELSILNLVSNRFKATSTGEIVNISHEELGWSENKERKDHINYFYAMDLKAL